MPNAADMVTLADAKQYLNSSSNDDALMQRLITAASVYLQSWMSRNIPSQAYSETRDGTGGNRLLFGNWPVTAVSSVYVDGVLVPPSPGYGFGGYYFDATKIVLRPGSFSTSSSSGNFYSSVFTRDVGNVQLSYTAGYTTIPEDLRQATLDTLAVKYRNRDRIGLMSKVLANESLTFDTSDLPKNVVTILNQYKAVFTP